MSASEDDGRSLAGAILDQLRALAVDPTCTGRAATFETAIEVVKEMSAAGAEERVFAGLNDWVLGQAWRTGDPPQVLNLAWVDAVSHWLRGTVDPPARPPEEDYADAQRLYEEMALFLMTPHHKRARPYYRARGSMLATTPYDLLSRWHNETAALTMESRRRDGVIRISEINRRAAEIVRAIQASERDQTGR